MKLRRSLYARPVIVKGEQCLWAELHQGVDELRQAVATFVTTCNTHRLIQRHGHRIPKEAYQAAQQTTAA